MGNILGWVGVGTHHMDSTLESLEERILKTLHKLEDAEFKIFKSHLRHPDVLEGLHPIPKSKSLWDWIFKDIWDIPKGGQVGQALLTYLPLALKKESKRTIARRVVRRYSCKEAQQIMVKVLKNIKRNDLAERFPDIPDKDQHEATVAETPMSSSRSTPIRKIEASVRNKFIDQHRRVLIEKVTNVKPILDKLLEERAISQEGYDNVISKATNQDMMRELYPALNNKTAKRIFFKGLLEYEKFLLDDLGCPQPSAPASTSVSEWLVKTGKKDKTYLPVKWDNDPKMKFEDVYVPPIYRLPIWLIWPYWVILYR